MRLFYTLFFSLIIGHASAQISFDNAYSAHPSVPPGLLEGVAWTNTRMVHRAGNLQSCSGIPQPVGIMGLHNNGQGYFKENAQIVADLSGIPVNDQINDAETQIYAYASAYESLINSLNLVPNEIESIKEVLHHLSEIPDTGFVNFMSKEMQVYEIFKFMNSNDKAQEFGFVKANIDLIAAFGQDNYNVLSSPKILFTNSGIKSENNDLFTISPNKSLQYGPAIWNPAPACNFSSRNGVAISAITIHTIQGTYAGAISWSQNCNSNVSFHYVIRSSDGQVTQMVLEEDKGWHVGSENPYTIGYEHEGYVDDPIWYTEEMYNSSADLSRDIVNSGYGIPPLRTYYGPSSVTVDVLGGCTKIKGHQHYPNQTHTDPGINWDWEKYYRLINDPYTANLLTGASGNLYDSGGPTGDYQDDERLFWLIQPANTSSITLDFSVFNVESGYDNLFIYDGDSTNAPLIGQYTGSNSPGTVISSGESLLLEFRSDCSTVSNGWEASYTSVPYDIFPPTTSIMSSSPWKTEDFIVDIVDTDAESGIENRFYLIAERQNGASNWIGNGAFGFSNESFDFGSSNWTNQNGSYNVNAGVFEFSDVAEQNSNSYMPVDQVSGYDYLYEWDQEITSMDVNQRAGMHFFCDDATLPNRGNSYFIYLRENDDKVQIYSVTNDVFTLQQDIPYVVDQGVQYNVKTIYSPSTGKIEVFVDDSLVGNWIDPLPHQSGNSISLRTGGCSAKYDNIRVYRSRSNTVNVTVDLSNEMSIESENALSTGLIRSIAIDSAGNWSSPDEEFYLLDFTPPEISYLNDGTAADIDTFYTNLLEGNWLATDIHSDVVDYEYALGTLPNLDNIIPWTPAGISTSLSEIISNPIYGETYHISLKVTNGAGLDELFISNGQTYLEGLSIVENELDDIVVYPNPVSNIIFIDTDLIDLSLELYDLNGKILERSTDATINVRNVADGKYVLKIQNGSQFILKSIIIKH
jgi:hypothetical protein